MTAFHGVGGDEVDAYDEACISPSSSPRGAPPAADLFATGPPPAPPYSDEGPNAVEIISQILGGIGLFLIGMVMTTDGLRAAAGDSLRKILQRFTGGSLQALFSGALVTAFVQSSSATTVVTISFVSAGLLTFSQSLGLILGANIGTTATGWIVALLGLKFSVSKIALPLVGLGALTRLFARGRLRDVGVAIAGFGILFTGLDVLQLGMAGTSDFITPDVFPSDSWLGRLTLVGIGFALTAVMQSSSAAIATTLTALDAGTISMMQAAAMAIGVNIGTTVTAGLAVIGAGTTARRTALAHVLFNAITGAVAFASLPLLVWTLGMFEMNDDTLTLAAFHTLFNVVGVVLVFPFIHPFAAYIERLIPEKGPRLTRRLSGSLADEGALAIEAVRATTLEIVRLVTEQAAEMVTTRKISPGNESALSEARGAVDVTHRFIASLRDLDNVGPEAQQRHVDVVHALDHIDQLLRLLRLDGEALLRDASGTAEVAKEVAIDSMKATMHWLDGEAESPTEKLEELSRRSAELRKDFRRDVLEKTAAGRYSAIDASDDIEFVRRLDELVYHLWKLARHLA